MDEALDLGQLGGLQEHMGAEDVIRSELERVTEGVIDMSLSSEVHDGIDVLCCKDVGDELTAADVAFDKLVVREVFDLIQIRQTRAVYAKVKGSREN